MVQQGTVTGPTTVTLATPVPVDKSFPIISWKGASRSVDGCATVYLSGIVDGNYTSIVVQPGNTTVEWQVISGDMFSVQYGVGTMPVDIKSLNVTLAAAVDRTKTFVVATTQIYDIMNSPGSTDWTTRVRAELTTDSRLVLTRSSAIDTYTCGARTFWYAVTLIGGTVQQFTDSIPSGQSYKDVTINAVNSAFIIHTWQYDGFGSTSYANNMPTVSFVDAASVRLQCYSAMTNIKVTGYVISHPQFRVMAGITDLESGSLTAQEIIETNISASFSVSSSRAVSVDSVFQNIQTLTRVAADNLALERTQSTAGNVTAWFVAEWTIVIPPLDLTPDDVALMPEEQNIFRWKKDASMTATAYEWGFREVGAALWTDTGKIESALQQHVVDAYTFEVGKSYEWRVRHWDDQQVDPSEWSQGTFNTSNPVIQNPTPVEEAKLKTTIIKFGARLKSPYGRDIQLTIEIADNDSYTNSTIYTLPAIASGELAIAEHALQIAGYWYVRMTATDSESLQTVLTYWVFAGDYFQFIDLPTVQLKRQLATHVTVRVRGTTTEYTAVISPAPAADKVVERLFYIPSGTQANCQAVAEAFLAKLGKAQISVSGRIPLTVTLKLWQKVRVVIPPAGIDQEMILQQKEHRINDREASTYVVLGDIQLSEQEQLNRIIERLSLEGT